MVAKMVNVHKRACGKSLMVVILTGMMLAMTGCYFLPEARDTLAPPLMEPPAKNYETIEVKKGSILRQITGKGIYEPLSSCDVYFHKSGGYLKNIYVKTGDEVKKGQLLAELDTDSLMLQIRRQQLQAEADEALYNKLMATGTIEMELAKKHLNDLKEEYGKALTVPDAYPAGELESMENMIMQQEIELCGLEMSYGVDENGNEGYQLKRASAALAASRKRLVELKEVLDNSQCFSPIDGVVVYRSDANMGEYIDAFRTLLRVADTSDVQLVCEERDVDKSGYFKTGMKVMVEEGGNVFEGVVTKTRKELLEDFGQGKITASQLKNRGYDIVIKVNEIDGKAGMGDSYNVVLEFQKKEDILTVPNNVIFTNGDRKYVLVLMGGEKYEREVEVGLSTGAESEIVKGLGEGERVVLR